MPHQAISFQSLFASLHHKLALLRIHSKVIIVCKNENALHLVLFLRSWNFVAISIRASAPIVNRIILHFPARGKFSLKSVFFLQRRQPHNFAFPRAARNFVEKHGLFSQSVCRNRAFYTKEGSPFCPFPAAKRRVLQGVMPNVHTFSSFSRSRLFSKF